MFLVSNSLPMRDAIERERRQRLFDGRTVGFEPWRQHQAFAEMRGILVDRKARSVGRKLEEHATRLLEVHRLEPEPVDHGSRVGARALDTRAHLELMLVIVYTPGQVVNRAYPPCTTTGFGCIAHIDDAGPAGR